MLPEQIQSEFSDIKKQLELGDFRMTSIEESLAESKQTHESNTKTLEEIKELLELGKTSIKLLRYLGLTIKWLSTLAAGCIAIWAIVSGHSAKG